MRTVGCWAFAVALAVAWPAAAQPPARPLADLSIDELLDLEVESVVGASKYEQKVTRAPAVVSIVTADEIRRYGYRTLADALRSVAGVFVSNDRNYEYVGVRGFARPGDYNSRLLLLLDGHRVNENLYDSFYVGADAIVSMDLVERIEVIRGSSSSIYGNSAFFGVINVITRRGRQVDGAEVSADLGSFATYGGRASYGRQFANDVDLLVSGSFLESDGQRRLYFHEFDPAVSDNPEASGDGVARDLDGERARRAFGRLAYHGFTATGAFTTRRKEVPTASFETIFNDGREHTEDRRGFVDLSYEHVASDALRVLARGFYDYYRYTGDYPYAADTPGGSVVNRDETEGHWVGAELQATRRVAGAHTVVVGAEYRENLRQRLRNFDTEPRAEYLDVDSSSRHVGLFAQAEVALPKALTLNAGLRYDRYSSFGGTLNPRVGLIYQPHRRSTVKLLYGRAFRAPNDYEMSYASEGTAAANPDLRPETIRTYEVAYEQYLPARHRFTVSAYRYDIADLISQGTVPETAIIHYDNLSQASAHGVEFDVSGRYRFGIEAGGSVAVQRARSSGVELSNSPRTLATARLGVPIAGDRWFGGVDLRHHGEARTLAGNEAPGFTLVGATLTRRAAGAGLDVAVSLRNLLNAPSAYPGAADHTQEVIEQDGRSARLTVTLRF